MENPSFNLVRQILRSSMFLAQSTDQQQATLDEILATGEITTGQLFDLINEAMAAQQPKVEFSSEYSNSPEKIEEEEFYDNTLIHSTIEDPSKAYQEGKRRFMKEYFAGIRCSGKNPPFMNLILKDGSPLKFLRVMDHVIKGIAIGQTNGIYYVMKLVAEVQPPPLTAEALEFERLYPQMAGAPGTGRVAPQQLMDIHNKVHILANNGTSNFFTDIYAGITCNVDVPFDAPDNGGKVLSQSMFVYEAGNVLFSEWLNSASPIQFHQAVQQWLLSFIVQSLVGFGHGDPHEANVVVCYFQPGGQWRYNIGDLSVFLPNNGFLLKMIDYDESDPNSNPLEGLQTLDVILGQTYPVLIGGRQQRNAEILPETMTFMADIAPLGKVKSTAEALEVIRRMNILTDLFVPTNAPILEEFNINVPLMAGDPTKARQAMGIDDQPQVPFSIPVPFGSFNSPPRTSGGSSMAFF